MGPVMEFSVGVDICAGVGCTCDSGDGCDSGNGCDSGDGCGCRCTERWCGRVGERVRVREREWREGGGKGGTNYTVMLYSHIQ